MSVKFDVVIPTLHSEDAAEVVWHMKHHCIYEHNYIIIDNGTAPKGHTEPCNRGYKAGNAEIVLFTNDDIEVGEAWDAPLVEEAANGTYCFCPWTKGEENMKLNGWFFCLRRDYIEAYGWAFDPRFIVWCGDVDLIRRLEEDHIEIVFVNDVPLEHYYSKTTSDPTLQQWIVPTQLADIERYKAKWHGSDPNVDKVRC